MKQYLQLLKDIKEKGTLKPAARENMPGTLSYFGYQLRHNLQDGFPLITTKKVYWKGVVVELLAFLRGEETIQFLKDNNCNIWNEDVKKFDPVDEIHWGKQYPYLWRNFGGNTKTSRRDKTPFKLDSLINELEAPYNDKIFSTRSYGKFKVLKEGKDKRGIKECTIQFLETGYKCLVRASRLNLDIYDPYYPSLCGVACLGVPEELNFTKELKTIWNGMIQRCYYDKKSNYKYYGGVGIKVINRWKCFQFFQEDVQKLPGWELKLKNWDKYELDKDLRNGKEYSMETCIWVSQHDNKRYKNFGKMYTVRNKLTNHIETFELAVDFLKRFPGSQGNFNAMLRGERKSYKNWELISIEDINEKKGVDQLANLIEGLKNNPMGRRHIITAWNPATLDDMALNACHALVQFNCRPISKSERNTILNNRLENGIILDASDELLDENKIPKYHLDCQMYQRSADAILGVPFNIASYALLTHIIAKICNMVPGEYIHTFGDAHIYEDHMEAVDEQLGREPRELPTLEISNNISNDLAKYDLDEVLPLMVYNDFSLINYNPHPKLESETKLSTGLK